MIVTSRASGDGAFEIVEIFRRWKEKWNRRKPTVIFHLRKEEK